MLKKLLIAVDRYDPYGFLRVSSMQALMVTLVLFLINFFFSPFAMTTALQIPVFGIITCSIERSFNNRLRNVAIFCALCISYAFLICIVQEYRALIVASVGLFIFTLFMLSKYRYPYMLSMVAMVQVVGYTLLKLPTGATFHTLLNYGISYIGASLLGLLLMYLFPRVYFFRVWLRIIYFTLAEFEDRLRRTAADEMPMDKLVFVHFIQMYDYTPNLSYRENGILARKFALLLVSIYAFTMVTFTRIEAIDRDKILELADACSRLRQAMDDGIKLGSFDFAPSENIQIRAVQKDFNQLLRYWNVACSKL
jgi:hypothetical protein